MKREISYISPKDSFIIRGFKDFWDEYCDDNGVVDNRQRKNIIHKHSFLTCLKELTTLSLMDIGSILNKDHATVLHASRSHEMNYKFDMNYRVVYNRLSSQLQQFMFTLDMIPKDLLDANKNLDSGHFKYLEVSKKLRLKILEFQEYKNSMRDEIKKITVVKDYIKSLESRNEKLNRELLRIKNLM